MLRYFHTLFTGWDQITNPFATGHMRLTQSGADTLVQVDRDGAGPIAFETMVTLQNVAAAALTALNLGDLPQDGAKPAGRTITGNEFDNSFWGTLGDDTMQGLGGNDRLEAYAGDDLLEGGDGDDTLIGGFGNDELKGGAGSDDLFGNAGNDRLVDSLGTAEQGGFDDLYGGDGDDSLTVDWTAYGPGTPDFHSALMDGGEGKDVLLLSSERLIDQALLFGGSGDDTFFTSAFAGGHLTIDAGSGDDVISLAGDALDCLITLGAGADLLYQLVEPMTSSSVVITDFEVGDQGDRLSLHRYFAGSLEQWDGETNPFASGHMRLVQSGADTLLQVDRDGAGPLAFETRVTLQNVTAAALTAFNFDNLPPDGSKPAGRTITGTEGGVPVGARSATIRCSAWAATTDSRRSAATIASKAMTAATF